MLDIPLGVLTQASACSGLVYTVCEWLNALPFEVRNVWGSTGLPRHLQWIYIVSQYNGLLGHVFYLTALNYLSKVFRLSRWRCDLYWWSQQYICIINLALLLTILSKRVYALWNRSIKIGVILLLLFTLSLATSIIIGAMAISNMTHRDQDCFVIEHFPREILYLGGTQVFVQLCLWGLTLFKCTSLRQVQISKTAIRLISRINRESFVIAFLACSVPGLVVVDGIWTGFSTRITYIAFPAFLTITSSLTCRAIRNMCTISQKVLQDRAVGGELEEEIVFTSIIVLD